MTEPDEIRRAFSLVHYSLDQDDAVKALATIRKHIEDQAALIKSQAALIKKLRDAGEGVLVGPFENQAAQLEYLKAYNEDAAREALASKDRELSDLMDANIYLQGRIEVLNGALLEIASFSDGWPQVSTAIRNIEAIASRALHPTEEQA